MYATMHSPGDSDAVIHIYLANHPPKKNLPPGSATSIRLELFGTQFIDVGNSLGSWVDHAEASRQP